MKLAYQQDAMPDYIAVEGQLVWAKQLSQINWHLI